VKRLISGPWHGLRLFALIAGFAVLCLASVVLVGGWGMEVSALRGPLPNFSTMKPNTAIGVGALGLALMLSQSGGPVRRLHLPLAALAAVLGALTLAEYGFGWDAGVDQLIFADAGTGHAFPGRPAPLAAVLLLLLGVGLMSPETRGWRHVKAACTLPALLVAWTLLNGYLFGHSGDPGALPFGSVAVHTAGSLFLIALGTLATEPGSWPVRTVFADNLGGTICRWLLPMAVVAPSLLGWLLCNPATIDSHEALNWALYAVSSSAGSVGLILILARRIEILDAERTAATMMSRRDALTGIANRRAFDIVLMESFSRARRYGRPLSLLTLDIDHFKSYNDTFGHPAGDEVLQAVSGVLVHVARESDLVARIGGEEFAMVLSETGAAGAHALAERIRASVAALKLQRAVTISVGVASLSPATPTATALLKESDTALYAAKRAGRDCVAVGGKRLLRQAH
jgi:diguanylate cyclase (GGDEF)-like protein